MVAWGGSLEEVCAYPDESVTVGFGGKVGHYELDDGDHGTVGLHLDKHVAARVPYDVLQVQDVKLDSCAKIRLWRCQTRLEVFDYARFNHGETIWSSVENSVRSETISKVSVS